MARPRLLVLAALPMILGACSAERQIAEHAICDGEICWCPDDFGNCDAIAANGCETDLRHDQQHCGACNASCNNGFCDARICRSHDGFDDCNGDTADGFEAHLPTDPRHCGTCDHDCLGGTCGHGQCNPYHFLEPGLNIWDIAADDAHLYLCSRPAGTIYRKPVSGGALEPFVVDQRCTHSLATSGDRVYWGVAAMLPSSFELEHWLYAAPVDGGQPELLATTTGEISYLSVGDTFAAYLADHRADGSDAVVALELATGVTHELEVLPHSSTTFSSVTTYGDQVYWASRVDGGPDQPDLGTIAMASGSQPSAVLIAMTPGYFIVRVQRLGDHLYWIETDINGDVYDQDPYSRLVRMHHEGGTAEVLHSSHYSLARLLVAAEGLYWTEGELLDAGIWLYRSSLDGGATASMADFQEIEVLTMNESALYWFDQPGKILGLAK